MSRSLRRALGPRDALRLGASVMLFVACVGGAHPAFGAASAETADVPTAPPVEPAVTPTAEPVLLPAPPAAPIEAVEPWSPLVAPPAPPAPSDPAAPSTPADPLATPPPEADQWPATTAAVAEQPSLLRRTPVSAEPPAAAIRRASVSVSVEQESPCVLRGQPAPQFGEDDEAGPCLLTRDQCSILGTPGADSLIGGPLSDLICGLGGDDKLDGKGGDDTLIGGSGDDQLTGGKGKDCLLGGDDRDEFPGGDREVEVIVDGDPQPPFVSVDDQARCRTPDFEGSTPNVPAGRMAGGGAVSAPVRTGSLVLVLAQLIQTEKPSPGAPPEPFAVSLEPHALARNGVARLLLRCPSAAVRGTLFVTMRQKGKRRAVGRARFTCQPPTDVVELTLHGAARRRLEARGILHLTVRLAIAGRTEQRASRVTIRSGQE